jgi:hypothetical protein
VLTRVLIIVAVLAVAPAVALLARAAAPIPVMLLDGESGGRYHDWQHVTPALKKMLDETGLFAVTVVSTRRRAAISPASLPSSRNTARSCSTTTRPTIDGLPR